MASDTSPLSQILKHSVPTCMEILQIVSFGWEWSFSSGRGVSKFSSNIPQGVSTHMQNYIDPLNICRVRCTCIHITPHGNIRDVNGNIRANVSFTLEANNSL